MTSRNSVDRLAVTESARARRAPARPASATAMWPQHPSQRHGLARVPGGQAGHLLGERPPLARQVVAEQPPDPQPEHHPPAANRCVGQPPLILAVHPGRRPPAPRARRRACPAACPDAQPRPADLSLFQNHPGQVRQQQSKDADML